jgi:hypothetical protein
MASDCEDLEDNPIATRCPFTETDETSRVDSCVSMMLSIDDQVHRGPFAASVMVDNKCGHGVAVLTTPVEVRVFMNREWPFPHELSTRAVYGILYVYPERVTRAELFWPADSGYRTCAYPEYVCVPPARRVRIPMNAESGDLPNLPVGEYSVHFQTMLARAKCKSVSEEIDLELSVARMHELKPDEPCVYKRTEVSRVITERQSFRVVRTDKR